MIQLTDDVLSDDMFEECFNFLNPTGSVFDFHNMDERNPEMADAVHTSTHQYAVCYV